MGPGPSSPPGRSPSGSQIPRRTIGSGSALRFESFTRNVTVSLWKAREGRNAALISTWRHACLAHMSVAPAMIPTATAHNSSWSRPAATAATPRMIATISAIWRRSSVFVCGRPCRSGARELDGDAHALEDLGQDLLRPAVPDPGVRREYQPVGEHRSGQRLDVVGEDVLAPLEEGPSPGGVAHVLDGAGAGPHLELRVVPAGPGQRDDVPANRRFDPHRGQERPKGEEVRRLRQRGGRDAS